MAWTKRAGSWLDKVTTMPRGNLEDHLGRLAAEDLVKLDLALIVFLGLAD